MFSGDGERWSPEKAADVSRAIVEHWRANGFGWHVAIEKASDSAIGFAALNHLGEGTAGLGPDEFEIGWWLLPKRAAGACWAHLWSLDVHESDDPPEFRRGGRCCSGGSAVALTSRVGNHKPQRPVIAREFAEMPVLGIPRSRCKIAAEPVHDPLLDAGVKERPHRLRRSDFRVQESLRPSPKAFEEAIDAVSWCWNMLDCDSPTEGLGDSLHRRKSGTLDCESFCEVVLLPGGQVIQIECEHDDPAACDAPHLRQSRLRRLPMVDRHACHGGVNRVVVKRQRLGAGVDRRCGSRGALPPHGCAWFDRQHPPIPRLIRTRTGPHIDHGTRITERPRDALGDAGIRLPKPRVVTSVLLVVHPWCHRESLKGSVPIMAPALGLTAPSRSTARHRFDSLTSTYAGTSSDLLSAVSRAWPLARSAHRMSGCAHGKAEEQRADP